MEATTLDLERQLLFAGLRVTRSRTTVLAAVHAHPHADTDMVVDAARQTLPDLSRQAVHDSLRALVETRLVRQLQLGPVVRFEAQGDDHHHALCTSCGRIANVDCVRDGPSCLSPTDIRGFTVNDVDVVYRGLCPDCAEQHGVLPPAQDRQRDGRRPASHADDGARPEPPSRREPDTPVAPPTPPAVVARSPSYPASRRARLGRSASRPQPDPLTPQPGQPWPQPDPPLTWTDGILAATAGRDQPRPAASLPTDPEPTGEPEAPPTAEDTQPLWDPAEPRRSRSRPPAADDLPHPTLPVETVGHGPSGPDTSPPAADAPTRRRARHEASRPQPV